ncbi:GTP-binding protein Obg1 [Plasmodium brasilianum]|uniref:GTP-binding protein Obg1 n=1 Tax=Plasmodium brasilianum TaxID=5824 RepID=A0ACB9Y541_PLABR|nr:GTP-binding protein Obg1 [Plasmodium brasilianum]
MLRGIILFLLMVYHEDVIIKSIPCKTLKENAMFLNGSRCREFEERKTKKKNYLECIKKMIKKNQFHDRCIINVKSGNGGDGICCFTTFSQKKNKKYASGGRGGKGGDIYLIGNKKIDNFLSVKLKSFYYAGNGGKGCNNNQNGECGKDEYIHIPINTIIYDEDKNFIDFIYINCQKVLVAKGGKGGKGNYSYRTKSLRIPFVCQYGEKTKEKKLFLKKIFFTDFGIIGYPNVGKSTLLNKITNANVKIANYSYTSKFPNFGIFKCEKGSTQEVGRTSGGPDDGTVEQVQSTQSDMSNRPDNEYDILEEEFRDEVVCEMGENENDSVSNNNGWGDNTGWDDNDGTLRTAEKSNYTVIDFPGIIKNLDKKESNISFKYLEHLKYSKILIYMFDINSNTIIETYENIKNVLVQYHSIFKTKKEVVVLNKIDIYNNKDKENINSLINYVRENINIDKIFCISALTGENVIEAINEMILYIDDENTVNEFIKTLPKPMDIEKIEDSDNFRPSEYEIHKYDEHIFIIKGKYIENQANIFNFSKCDSSKVFRKILDDLNINTKLKNVGARDGDKIIISNYSFDFILEY